MLEKKICSETVRDVDNRADVQVHEPKQPASWNDFYPGALDIRVDVNIGNQHGLPDWRMFFPP